MLAVPQHATLVALIFLATGLACGGGALLLIGLWLAGRPQAALRLMAGLVTLGALYGFALLAPALASGDRTLEAGEAKYFCELDCHFAVTLAAVSKSRSLGEGASRVEADGVFHVVTVRAWFDASTVTSRRPSDAPLYTGPRRIRLVDGAGRTWAPSAAGQGALGEPVDALDRKLAPGASYEARYVFDVPADARDLRLLVEDRSLVSRFLIGHENSPFHGDVGFDVSGAEAAGPRGG